jgi:Flp pilus assembly CpaE family ATPase
VSIGVLVALGTAPFETAVLSSLAGERTHVVRRCVDLADLLATAASGQAQVALVAASLPGISRDAVEALTDAGVDVVGVAASAGDADSDVLVRWGVAVVDVGGSVHELVEAVVAAAAESRRAGDSPADATPGSAARHRDQSSAASESARRPDTSGRVIAIWGPTGAPGRTVVALGLAAAIADLGGDTLVVDADVYGGTVAQMAGVLDETSGLLAAARAANTGALDASALGRSCLQLAPRLRVLTGLPRADRWVEAKASSVRAVLETSRRLVSHTVVDCGFSVEVDEEVVYDTRAPRRNGATLEVLRQADTVVIVGSADPVGLGRLVRAVGELSEAVPGARPRVVVNRVRERMGWSPDDIEAMLRRTAGVTHIVCLPDDPTACDRALLAGRTLVEAAPQSRLTRRLREMAAELSGLTAPVSRRSWLARLGGQGRKSSHSPVSV